jgi:hypothetical protein
MQKMKTTVETFINGRTLKSFILRGDVFLENKRFINIAFDERDDLSNSSFFKCYFENCTFSFKDKFSSFKINSSVFLHCTFSSMFVNLFASKAVFSGCSFFNSCFDACKLEKVYIYDSKFYNFYINVSTVRSCTFFDNEFTFLDKKLDIEKLNTLFEINIDFEILLTFLFETNMLANILKNNKFKVVASGEKTSHIIKNMLEFNEITKKSDKNDEYWLTY